jgi:hypothetical protein
MSQGLSRRELLGAAALTTLAPSILAQTPKPTRRAIFFTDAHVPKPAD